MSDAITTKLARRFGPGVAEWTAGLGVRVDDLARRWRLTVRAPIDDGASSYSVHVTTADGLPAVLKLSPDVPFLAEQAALLRWWAVSGRVPAVLADGPGALLMAAVRPGTDFGGDVPSPAPGEYADLLGALHAVPLPDIPLGRDLRGRTEEFLHRAITQLTDPVVAARLHRSDFERALAELDDVLAVPAPTVLLHGDLHLGNVLADHARGLVAIDPKACLGDPCFDAADYVVAGAGRDGVEHRLTALSDAAGLDRDRLYAWSRLVAAVTAIPLLRTGNRDRAVDELLALSR